MSRSARRWWTRGAAVAATLLSLSRPATGHERPSYAHQISAAGEQVAIQTTFGLVLGRWTEPEPGSWRWICREAMGSIPVENPATFFLNDGTLLMPGFDGLTLGTDDACNWRPATSELTNVQVFSGARAPRGMGAGYALTSRPRAPNAVFVTEDGGRTWTTTGEQLSGAGRYDSVVVAPSDPMRLYVGASSVASNPSGSSTATIYRSEDGGATWTSTTTPMSLGERTFKIRAVSPNDPDVLLASFSSAFSGRLVASTDGGRSFEDVLELASIDALAWRPDGEVVVLSGMNEAGVWRSTNGGQSFEQLRDDLDLRCLTYIEDELWACGGVDVETAVTRSFDDGDAWSPVMRFETDIDVDVSCGAETTVGQVCPAAVAELRSDFGLPPLSGGEDAGPSDAGGSNNLPDGGPPDLGPPSPSLGETGGGCSSTGTQSLAWLLLMSPLIIRRLRARLS